MDTTMSITVIAILALPTSLADRPKLLFGIDPHALAVTPPPAYAPQALPDVPNFESALPSQTNAMSSYRPPLLISAAELMSMFES